VSVLKWVIDIKRDNQCNKEKRKKNLFVFYIERKKTQKYYFTNNYNIPINKFQPSATQREKLSDPKLADFAGNIWNCVCTFQHTISQTAV